MKRQYIYATVCVTICEGVFASGASANDVLNAGRRK
jgi:hypothetical protein